MEELEDIKKAQLDAEYNVAIGSGDQDLYKAWINNAQDSLEQPTEYLKEKLGETLVKAKYLRREGAKGKYKYVYAEKKSTKHGDGGKIEVGKKELSDLVPLAKKATDKLGFLVALTGNASNSSNSQFKQLSELSQKGYIKSDLVPSMAKHLNVSMSELSDAVKSARDTVDSIKTPELPDETLTGSEHAQAIYNQASKKAESKNIDTVLNEIRSAMAHGEVKSISDIQKLGAEMKKDPSGHFEDPISQLSIDEGVNLFVSEAGRQTKNAKDVSDKQSDAVVDSKTGGSGLWDQYKQSVKDTSEKLRGEERKPQATDAAIAENDKKFKEHLEIKGIQPSSYEASQEWRNAGFRDKQMEIHGKKESDTSQRKALEQKADKIADRANSLSKRWGGTASDKSGRLNKILDSEVSDMNFENESAKQTFLSVVKQKMGKLDNYKNIFPPHEYK